MNDISETERKIFLEKINTLSCRVNNLNRIIEEKVKTIQKQEDTIKRNKDEFNLCLELLKGQNQYIDCINKSINIANEQLKPLRSKFGKVN